MLEIGTDGDVGQRGQQAAVVQFLLQGYLAIGLADRHGKTRTGGRQGLEAGLLQQQCGTHIPGIGNDEGFTAFVQGAEGLGFFQLAGHG